MQSTALIEKQCARKRLFTKGSRLNFFYHFPYEDEDMIYFPKSSQIYKT